MWGNGKINDGERWDRLDGAGEGEEEGREMHLKSNGMRKKKKKGHFGFFGEFFCFVGMNRKEKQ